MPLTPTSASPFAFKTQLSLVLLTGWRATDVRELRKCLEEVPESSVYHHTHHFIEQHHHFVQEPPNDFAYWVTTVLNDVRIGERLASIDTVRFRSLADLRRALIEAMDPCLAEDYVLRKSPVEQNFHFMKSLLFDLKTPYTAKSLAELAQCLRKVSNHSLYYHMFEARLRTPQGNNDFSHWLESMGETALAKEIERLDPYSQSMDSLRSRMVRLIEKRLSNPEVTRVAA
jgi:hypothetical protein